MEYKALLGYLAVLIALVSYVIYFNQIFRGKIKPHAFSWFVWGLLTSIAFVAQVVKNGGAGSWVTGVTALVCFVVCIVAFFKGDKKFLKIDWIFLLAALISILLWWFTKQPTLSVILVTIADNLGVFPTLRKSYYKPYEESATVFAFSVFKWIPAIIALSSYSFVNWIYPTSLIVSNALVVFTILTRRNHVPKT